VTAWSSGGPDDDEAVRNEEIDGDAADTGVDELSEESFALRESIPPPRLALVFGLAAVVALGGLSGWLGHRAIQSQLAEGERGVFVEAARRGAVNLTSIDFQRVDADVKRILDSATVPFYDEFAERAPSFVEAAKRSQSTSVGTVTAAGIESLADSEAKVLVAVSVNTSQVGASEPLIRLWRMRMTVRGVGSDVMVSKVEFL
jgi:Mce-associated membrane protein